MNASDPSGHRFIYENQHDCGGGVVGYTDTGSGASGSTNSNSIVSHIVSIYHFITNADPEKCKNSAVSMYKGVPVFNIQSDYLDRMEICSFSFGAIFLINESQKEYETTLSHERGHSTQFLLLGPLCYLKRIAVPSILYNEIDRLLPNDDYYVRLYYSWPWERGADFFEGVSRGEYVFDESGILSMLYLLCP